MKLSASNLNRRAAKYLGLTISKSYANTVRVWWGHIPVGPEFKTVAEAAKYCPDFCRDPFAAEMLRKDIERRGGSLLENTCKTDDGRDWTAGVEIGSVTRNVQSTEGRGFALTVAYVLTCKALKKEGKRSATTEPAS